MIHRLALAGVAILLAAPLAAQAPAASGLQMRVDASTSASDPDDNPEVRLVPAPNGVQVTTGPAAVLWNPANTATGSYSLKGRFTLQAPSDHVNYYGLVFGGRQLEAAGQAYLYFLVAQDGTFLVKHRAGEATHDVKAKTAHAAIARPGANGSSVNDLEVRVAGDTIEFLVNNTLVHTQARTGMAGGTDGVYGVRINHRLPGVVVEGLTLTPGPTVMLVR